MHRIGVTFPGADPSRRGTWSGTPRGIIQGLQECGVEAVPIRIGPPRLARALAVNTVAFRYLRHASNLRTSASNARTAASASPIISALDSRSSARSLGRELPLDAIIQIGTGYHLDTDLPIATVEDMTVMQTVTHPYPGWDLLSPREFRSRVECQRDAYQQAKACCLTSRWAAQSVIDDYGVPVEKVHVVGVGRNRDIPKSNPDWNKPHFLFVGLEWERKNGEGVLRAFRKIHDEFPEAQLDVVGGHPTLEQPGVVFHGVLRLDDSAQQEQLGQLFADATCFVMPSHSEASAIAYVEAAAAGIPSIGTSSGGSDYLIGDGGLIVDPSNDQELVDAMRRLCDPRTAEQMGAAARERSEQFTWPAVAARILAALRD